MKKSIFKKGIVFIIISFSFVLYIFKDNRVVIKPNDSKQTKIYYEKDGRRI